MYVFKELKLKFIIIRDNKIVKPLLSLLVRIPIPFLILNYILSRRLRLEA